MNSDDIIGFGKALGIAILLLVVASIIILGLIGIIQAAFGPSDEQKAEMRVPQLLSESDGCRVYKFVDDGTHYFTRCGEQVDTVRHYTESCGKNCTRRRTESIATEGNK
jgi:hypothetical protein